MQQRISDNFKLAAMRLWHGTHGAAVYGLVLDEPMDLPQATAKPRQLVGRESGGQWHHTVLVNAMPVVYDDPRTPGRCRVRIAGVLRVDVCRIASLSYPGTSTAVIFTDAGPLPEPEKREPKKGQVIYLCTRTT